MTAKRNRHKQSVQPKVIEIATRKYLAIAIVITFLLSVILTVIQIVSLSGYTSHLADTGARQLEQRLELALQNIQSNASMLRVSRETAKLSQTVSFTEEALRSINYMETLNTIKLTDDALYDIWVLNEDRGVVYTASRTRYSADVPAIRNHCGRNSAGSVGRGICHRSGGWISRTGDQSFMPDLPAAFRRVGRGFSRRCLSLAGLQKAVRLLA